MICSTFIKKLPDYLEGNLPEDMENAFKNHKDKCIDCKNIYDEEILMDNSFRMVLNADNIKFNSSRMEIIKNIDVNRYSKGIANKLRFHLKRKKITYSTMAALIAIFIFTTPYLEGYINSRFSEKKSGVASEYKISQKIRDIQTPDLANGITSDKALVTKADKNNNIPTTKFVVKLDKTINAQENIDLKEAVWKDSENSKLTFLILGKGTDMQEEGIAKIWVKDLKNSDRWTFTVPTEKNKNQYSPKFAQWYDDENIILVAGLGYGTVTRGGNLYFANMISGEVSVLYEADSIKEEITSIKKVGKDLELSFNVYEDDNMMKSHSEKGLIKAFDPKTPGMIERYSQDGTVRFDKLNVIEK